MITADEVRKHLETDLPKSVLEQLIASARQYIEDHVGPQGTSKTDVFSSEFPGGLGHILWLRESAVSITSVTEVRSHTGKETELSANDYRLRGTKELLRQTEGDNPASVWPMEVRVEYKTEGTEVNRMRTAIIDIVRLMVENRGLESERSGDWQGTFKDIEEEKRKVIQGLKSGRNRRTLA